MYHYFDRFRLAIFWTRQRFPVDSSSQKIKKKYARQFPSGASKYLLHLVTPISFQHLRLYKRGIKLQEDPAAVLVLLEEGAMQIDLPEAMWRKMQLWWAIPKASPRCVHENGVHPLNIWTTLNGETDDSPKLRGSLFAKHYLALFLIMEGDLRIFKVSTCYIRNYSDIFSLFIQSIYV